MNSRRVVIMWMVSDFARIVMCMSQIYIAISQLRSLKTSAKNARRIQMACFLSASVGIFFNLTQPLLIYYVKFAHQPLYLGWKVFIILNAALLMIFTIEACYIIYLIASAHYTALMYSSDRIINTFPGWASRLFSIYAIMCEASIIVSVVLVFIFGSVKYAAIKHFGIATLILLTGSHFCLALYHIRGVLEQSISKLTSSSSMRGSGMPIRDSSSSQQQHREEESGGYYHRLSDRASDSNSRQPYKAKETSSSTCQTRPFIKQQDIRSKVSIDAFGSDYHTSDKSRGLSLHDQKYPSASSNGIRSLQRRQDGGSILDGSSSHESFSDSQRATSFVYVPESHIRRVKASVNKLKRMIVVFGVVTAAAVPSEYFYGVREIQSTELYADRCNKESERYNPLTDFAHYLLTIGIYVFQHYAYVRNVNG